MKTVFVAMSGGVDSSVAAALLKQCGFRVVGVFMRNWHHDDANLRMNADAANNEYSQFVDSHKIRGFASRCSWELDQASARMAAAKIGIPLYTWDFSKEYKEQVVNYMIDGYRKGETPNPDVMCNRVIKFGLFFAHARKLGADYVATGHYARVEKDLKIVSLREISSREKNWKLKIGVDANKDQSYFLWTLNQEQLAHTLFPIGEYTKPEVRELARKFELPNAERKDSQGLCFVGKVDFRNFLANYLPEKPGLVMTVKGKMIGTHPGVHFYTIGQRHGIGIGGSKEPYFVVGKDAEKNILYVAEGKNHPALYEKEITVRDVHWIDDQKPRLPLRCQARIRYRQSLQDCILDTEAKSYKLKATFAVPQRAPAPGQSIVFYLPRAEARGDGDLMLGGGIIGSKVESFIDVHSADAVSAVAA
ncbi:MAG: tRNA 2-thiouridine(34) synthase MnmA [Parcubacteria group bacterium]|nr:tRNA 2-thiouridine(34) synthase MnmA [Parcubacteria group bacterium]